MTERTAGTSLQYVLPYLQTMEGFEPSDSLCRLRDFQSRSHSSYCVTPSYFSTATEHPSLHCVGVEPTSYHHGRGLSVLVVTLSSVGPTPHQEAAPRMLQVNLNPRHSVHAEPYAAKGDVSLDLIFCFHWAVNPMGFGQDFKHLCRPRPYHLRFDHCYAQAFP